jgi:hypothetical protein
MVSVMVETMTVGTTAAGPDLADVIRDVRDAAAAGTVFGAPVRQDDVTVIPTALFKAFGGGESDGEPMGGRPASGVRVLTRPAGAFVIAKGRATWRPAIDINRIVLGGQIVAVVALLTIRAIVLARSRRRA